MPEFNFRQIFPKIDDLTEYHLKEIVYCLEHYVKIDNEKAYKKIVSSENLRRLLDDDPAFMRHEHPFYWAMCLEYGFDSKWWHDKLLNAQCDEYVKERYRPPTELNKH